MKIGKSKFVIACLVLICLYLGIGISSAATVEVTSGKLTTQVEEKKQVDLSIQIKDFESAKQLTLETSLVSADNKPIWDFGKLNSIVDGSVNRYQQKLILNISSLPSANMLDVSISGRSPDGDTTIECPASVCGYDLTLIKFTDTKLKFYEVHLDDKSIGLEPFDLIIEKKKSFETTISQIGRKEFDGVIREDRILFNNGSAIEAQNIADELKNIKWPDNLSLFGIAIGNDLWLDISAIIILIVGIIIGFIIGTNIDTGSIDTKEE